jgi:aspartate carbamoyltransferase catalytic subunit
LLKHIITAKSVAKERLEDLFRLADKIRVNPQGYNQALRGKVLGTFFKEPSTRTRLSFEAAMCRLGGTYVSVENAANSSQAKGESLRDTLLTMSQMVDVIVVRQGEPDDGDSLATASESSRVPVINGGEGRYHHPTQAMLDLYTIWRKYQSIPQNINVLLVGDPERSRTVASLLQLLSKYDVQVTAALHYPSDGVCLREHFADIKLVPESDISMQLPKTNVLYMTRFQDERIRLGDNWKPTPSCFILYRRFADMMPEDAVILHPFPRRSELPSEIDLNPRAAYVQQMENGMWLRMALLLNCLGQAMPSEDPLTITKLPYITTEDIKKKWGFPESDEHSIQAGIFYSHQFVQNEEVDNVVSVQCEPVSDGTTDYKYRYGPLAHGPILEGTVTGVVNFWTQSIATFHQTSSGMVVLTEVEGSKWQDKTVTVKEIILNAATGEFSVNYAGCPPLDHNLIVSYEYDLKPFHEMH